MADERDEIIRELVAALTPFANQCGFPSHTTPSHGIQMKIMPPSWCERFVGPLQYKHFQNARAALDRAKEQTP